MTQEAALRAKLYAYLKNDKDVLEFAAFRKETGNEISAVCKRKRHKGMNWEKKKRKSGRRRGGEGKWINAAIPC